MNSRSSFDSFRRAAEPGNLVPVWADVEGAVPDPVSAYKRFRTPDASFLLESADPEGNLRRSVIGSHPWLVVYFGGGRMTIHGAHQREFSSRCVDPLEGIGRIISGFTVALENDPHIVESGLVGSLDYEVIRHWEKIKGLGSEVSALPEARFMAAGRMVVYDHVSGRVRVGVMAGTDREPSVSKAYSRAMSILDESIRMLEVPVGPEDELKEFSAGPLRSGFSKDDFESAVEAVKEFVRNGEVIQVVVSRRLSGRAGGDDLAFYKSLRSVSPSPYMFHMAFGDTRFIGASPEMLVSLKDGKITYKPIAGTRPRGTSRDEDADLENELLEDEKERAEHVMLVDLGRNDLGRVAAPGSVRVKSFMHAERFSHVIHLVSRIEAELEEGLDGLDLLKSVFPAGTVTGAPKVRAMEIIHDLEPCARGPYAGALGCIGWNGDLDFCIPIRTAFLEGDRITLQAGAGIVHDSVPAMEFLETSHKARSLISAIRRSSAA